MSNLRYTERVYKLNEVSAFRKTAETFGGLSNMAPGYPIKVNSVTILTTEALYQACRFPHMPEIQERIIKERSPMTAKMVSKPFRSQSRPDFEQIKVDVMRWCLRIKLAQNFINFGKLLESTGNTSIVEDSHKDAFWGAIRDKQDSNTLKGVNALGRLLMELRQQYFDNKYTINIFKIEPLNIPNFQLLGQEICSIDERSSFINNITRSLCISHDDIAQNKALIRPLNDISSNNSKNKKQSEFSASATNSKVSNTKIVGAADKATKKTPSKRAKNISEAENSLPLFHS